MPLCNKSNKYHVYLMNELSIVLMDIRLGTLSFFVDQLL